MLVLSRTPGQEIILQTSDGPITLALVEIRKGLKARIGITAPASVAIYRPELTDKVRPANGATDAPQVAAPA